MRIGTFSQHVGSNIVHNVKSIAGLKVALGGLTEQDLGRTTTLPLIRGAIGDRYDVLTKDKGGHSQEVPILLRRRLLLRYRLLSVEVELVAAKVGELGIGNDRYQTTVRLIERRFLRRRPRRKIAVIQTHWMAAIQDRATGRHFDNARWQAMDATAGKALEKKIRLLKSQGFQVVVGGDFNYRQHGIASKVWFYAPERIFARTGMNFVSNGLDYLGWTAGLRVPDGVHVIPSEENDPHAVNRSDHPWLWADFHWA